MNKLIRYLIYKNYNWQLTVKMWNPLNSGINGVVLPISMIVLAVSFYLSSLFDFELGAIIMAPSLLVLFLYDYYLRKYVKRVKIENIIKEFADWDKPREKLTTILVLFYSLIAVFAPILVLIFFIEKA